MVLCDHKVRQILGYSFHGGNDDGEIDKVGDDEDGNDENDDGVTDFNCQHLTN